MRKNMSFFQYDKSNKSDGFTIVELLVTMIVGAVLAGSVSVFLSLHTHVAQRGRDVSVTNSYVENKIESLRSAGFLSLADGTTDITSELPTELKSPRSGSMVISSESSSIKQVDISITYSDQGAPRTYTYTTFVGELGVGQY
jgi:prepilin-type N-terminal cleavage/methylation domain-containing protein